jgi:hypothetical protein
MDANAYAPCIGWAGNNFSHKSSDLDCPAKAHFRSICLAFVQRMSEYVASPVSKRFNGLSCGGTWVADSVTRNLASRNRFRVGGAAQ